MRRVVVAAIPKYGGDSVLLRIRHRSFLPIHFTFVMGSYSMEDRE